MVRWYIIRRALVKPRPTHLRTDKQFVSTRNYRYYRSNYYTTTTYATYTAVLKTYFLVPSATRTVVQYKSLDDRTFGTKNLPLPERTSAYKNVGIRWAAVLFSDTKHSRTLRKRTDQTCFKHFRLTVRIRAPRRSATINLSFVHRRSFYSILSNFTFVRKTAFTFSGHSSLD